MKDRIREIMDREGMTQQAFANELQISPALLSRIFKGDIKADNQVNAIHRAFPKVNINWLMFGEGEMYDGSEGEDKERTLEDLMKEQEAETNTEQDSIKAAKPHNEVPAMQTEIRYIERPSYRKITEIRVYFDNGTYETFRPDKE
ncbi:MAG: helix-turn-helix transcriptional regulator [Bacteroidaceae bacterium]|nr:helix-turn-helix transcriptional regulator [Bacteroidaceae bacterium]